MFPYSANEARKMLLTSKVASLLRPVLRGGKRGLKGVVRRGRRTSAAVRLAGARRRLRELQAQGQKVVVLYIVTAGIREHMEPVLQALLARKRFIIVVVSRDSRSVPTLAAEFKAKLGRSLSSKVFIVRYSDFEYLDLVPHALVSFHPESKLPFEVRPSEQPMPRVVMLHGLSDKGKTFGGRSVERFLDSYNALFLTGPVTLERYQERYLSQHPDSSTRIAVFEVGHPKVDSLFDGTYDRAKISSSLEIDPTKKTVLYAPTFEKWGSLETCGLDVIERLASMDVNLLVKLHHWSLCTDASWSGLLRSEGHGGKDWRGTMREVSRQFPNCKLVEGNANPYLVVSDLMVSDASGVAYEFVLQNKPVVFIDVPALFQELGPDGIHYWGRSCGDIVYDLEQLTAVVQRNLRYPEATEAQRLVLIDRLVYNKGSAAAKAGEIIEGMIDGGVQHPT
jgi:hypothetical protein